MNLAARHQDRLLVAGALALALTSFGWFGWRSRATGNERPGARVGSAASAYAADGEVFPAAETGTWAPPPAQSRGPDWVYEVFTPAEIFYNARTRRFSVTAPSTEAESRPAPEPERPFGLELVEVKRGLFRLQLVGYVGGEGNYRGTFANTQTGETYLAGVGRKIADLGVEIISLNVGRQQVQLPNSMVSNQIVATALVRDERSGESVTLNSLERTLTNTPVAVVAESAAPARRHELRLGEAFTAGRVSFKISKIQLAPPLVDVTKESPSFLQPELRTLTLPAR